MDVIANVRDKLTFYTEMLETTKALVDELGQGASAVKVLRRFARGETDSKLQELFDAFEVDEARQRKLRDAIERHDDLLDLLGGTVGDLGGKVYKLELDKQGRVGAGQAALDVGGSLAARFDVDVDGVVEEGPVSFDADSEAFLRIGVDGKLRGHFEHSGLLGKLPGSTAFSSEASIALHNFFRHRRSDRALEALLGGLKSFELPGTITAASDLAVWKSNAPDADSVVEAQYVHLAGGGYVQLGAQLGWSSGFLASASVDSDRLGLNEVLPVKGGVFAKARFSGLMRGNFDILVSRDRDDEGKVRVRLSKQRLRQREAGFSVGAELSVEGLDRVARQVLGRASEPLEELIGKLERAAKKGSDLDELLSAKLVEEADALESAVEERIERKLEQRIQGLVGKASARKELAGVLRKLDTEVDLSGMLRKLIDEKVLDVAGEQLDRLDRHVNKISEKLLGLIGDYRRAQHKLHRLIDKAAKAKLAVTFERFRERMEKRDLALEFRIDPARDPDLYRTMLRGDFEPALSLALQPDDNNTSLEIIDASLRQLGSRKLTESLTITAINRPFTSKTLLQQEWVGSVSLSGEINIASKGSLKRNISTFHRTRTFNFLSDARLLGSLADASGSLDNTLALEVIEELERGKTKLVRKLQNNVARAAAFGEPPDLVSDLAGPSARGRRLGHVVSALTLELPAAVVREIVAGDTADLVSGFALHLVRLFDNDDWEALDADGRPAAIFALPSADRFFEGNPPLQPDTVMEFGDGTGNARRYRRVGAMFHHWRLMRNFGRAMGRLNTMARLGTAATLDQNIAAIRDAQWELLQSVKKASGGAGWYRASYALFAAFREQAGKLAEVTPHLVVKRMQDERVFVYEA